MKIKNLIPPLFIFFFILFYIFLIKPAITGELGVVFRSHPTPHEYVELNNFLRKEDRFFRTLWIPAVQRYGFFSEKNPAVSGEFILKTLDPSSQIAQLKNDKMVEFIQKAGIRYIVVPFDSEGEIFLNDRKYDDRIYSSTVKGLESIEDFDKIGNFGKVVVFEVAEPRERIWSESDVEIKYKMLTQAKYEVEVIGAKAKDRVIFSDSYNKNWKARIDGFLIESTPYDRLFNSFILPKDGNYRFEVFFEPQKFINVGYVISSVVLLATIFLIRR